MKAEKEPVRLRGHQLREFFLYYIQYPGNKPDGFFNKMIKYYGYKTKYTRKLKDFLESLKDDTPIRIVDRQGSLCELGCPHRRPHQSCHYKNYKNHGTYSAAYVSNLDRDTAANCSIEIGKVYTLKELKDLLKDKKKILFS